MHFRTLSAAICLLLATAASAAPANAAPDSNISNGAMGANRIPCKKGTPSEKNCIPGGGQTVNPPSRGCSSITQCSAGKGQGNKQP
ncbi:hypothetical protein AAF712_014537 [Marasmius tenuissimus]|uniref:Uncharacterized protein n=1 Tax=Marasmius tenuissimus TaxID=585030 RepID=A0ABR2ZBP7_9AGAR|nr:hypothetical protein PM082_011331 [Marasmius tenuissimus]